MRRIPDLAVEAVARIPARMRTKLLVAFLVMVGLLVVMGAVGLRVLSGMSQQTEELIELQRKIAAYRHVQHDTTRQLYGVASALAAEDESALDVALRQLAQFGYDLDRLQYVASSEAELMAEVEWEYQQFVEIVSRVVELARAGELPAARSLQFDQARPLADRLERLTNQLVNLAEADMVEHITEGQRTYLKARVVVAFFALGSVILALGLGYALSWSIVGPVTAIETRLRQIASGDFSQRVQVANRDELGALADNVNRTREELGRLYSELERSIRELRLLGKVSGAVNSSLQLDNVLTTVAEHATALAEADAGIVYSFDDSDAQFRIEASYRLSAALRERLRREPVPLGRGAVGRAGSTRQPVQVADIEDAPEDGGSGTFAAGGYRALLAAPLLHDEVLIGALLLAREDERAFDESRVALVQTLANQSALAIQNARLFQEIEQKGRQLELANRHKSQFVANMSHELRTPLNAILGFTELMRDGVYGEPAPKLTAVLERVQANGRHLLGLINEVLDLSKIDAGRLELSMDEYSLRDVVTTVVSATESLAREKGLALRVELPDCLPVGYGDERRITQVFLNLLGNAIKFTEVGEVKVTVTLEGETVSIGVADTGPGIPEAERQRIFDEFHQVDSSITRKQGGTGLGLAIAKRIVDLHGGRLSVTSQLAQGSTFVFSLPLRAEQKQAA